MVDSVPHWYHQFKFAPNLVTPGAQDSAAVLEWLNLPQDLGGLSVLDIGARDGFFSFECERRGATEVLAIDYVPEQFTGFPVAKKILGSRLNLVHESIYNLTPERYGRFDLVLFPQDILCPFRLVPQMRLCRFLLEFDKPLRQSLYVKGNLAGFPPVC